MVFEAESATGSAIGHMSMRCQDDARLEVLETCGRALSQAECLEKLAKTTLFWSKLALLHGSGAMLRPMMIQLDAAKPVIRLAKWVKATPAMYSTHNDAFTKTTVALGILSDVLDDVQWLAFRARLLSKSTANKSVALSAMVAPWAAAFDLAHVLREIQAQKWKDKGPISQRRRTMLLLLLVRYSADFVLGTRHALHITISKQTEYTLGILSGTAALARLYMKAQQ